MGELSIHRWKGFELYPVINKKTVYTNCNPAGVQLCPSAAVGCPLPGNVKFCFQIQHLCGFSCGAEIFSVHMFIELLRHGLF
jgi:hypothetical protein